jgi:hypothetical protein
MEYEARIIRRLRSIAFIVIVLAACLGGLLWLAGRGNFGSADREDLRPRAGARSARSLEASSERQRLRFPQSPDAASGNQILFGDLHVHTTISFDAFMLNLPIMGGEGAHTLADACDFARHCAALDFYSLNDHASNIHPEDWLGSIESVRQCNALAGDPQRPDLVAFLGWEWTQMGLTPETHYGHKNVVLARTDDAHIPSRPIAATAGGVAAQPPSVWARGALALQGDRFHDLAKRWTELSSLPICEEAPVRSLDPNCREIAATPADLFRKLDDWGHDSIVIPHGTAWGIYTPPESSWEKQLQDEDHDPERQTLIEVYSGHGDSEAYRNWRAVNELEDGGLECAEAREDYLPMCQRAGQIIESRCLAEGESADTCSTRAARARQHAANAGVGPHITVPGTTAEDWLDAGQCRDCQQPSFHYRPTSSAQAIAAIGGFSGDPSKVGDPVRPRRFRMGFIASSDIHTARAGSGYKEFRFMTDSGNRAIPENGGIVSSFLRGPQEEPSSHSRPVEEARKKLSGLQAFETERTQSFMYTGGLVAVHAQGRDRASIWSALEKKHVYGTSGPRILLDFALLAGGERHPMGSEVELSSPPRFEVRATGSFEEKPGCPEENAAALGAERLRQLCRGECHNPGEKRRPIGEIEVIRIRPQNRPGEKLADLIEDPWLHFDCPGDPEGCRVEFEDPDFVRAGRETLYYVRVFEAEKPTVNAATLRCQSADGSACLEIEPCSRGEECLAPDRPRAWSSPIYVDYIPGAQERRQERREERAEEKAEEKIPKAAERRVQKPNHEESS